MQRSDPRVRQGQDLAIASVEAFVQRLSRVQDVDGVVLFGSWARGEALDSSDFDIAIISGGFGSVGRFERADEAYRAWYEDPPGPVDFVCLTPEEFRRMSGPLAWDILDEGVVLVDTGVVRERREWFAHKKERGEFRRISGGWLRAQKGSS